MHITQFSARPLLHIRAGAFNAIGIEESVELSSGHAGVLHCPRALLLRLRIDQELHHPALLIVDGPVEILIQRYVLAVYSQHILPRFDQGLSKGARCALGDLFHTNAWPFIRVVEGEAEMGCGGAWIA